MNVLERLEKEHMRIDMPPFRPGDTIKVHVKIKEGDKERLQAFQGVVISKRKSGLRSSYRAKSILWRGRGENISVALSGH